MTFEYEIIKFLQTNATPNWISFFQVVTMLGSYLGFFLTFIIVFLKNRKLSIALALTFAVGAVFNHFLKALIGRNRPFDKYLDIVNYGNEDGFSFPSGHSVCAGIFATYLFYTILKSSKNKLTIALGGVALSLTAILIAFSRVVLGVHYPSDTIFGLFLGISFAILGILIYNIIVKRIKRKNC